MPRPDILIFFSDQHNYQYNGFAGSGLVRTPHLDKLAAEGTLFTNAYTACPLCVPARTSFMTGQYASTTGVFTNSGTYSGDKATFMHALAAEGYETVLCGRMHFVGEDQRHGFTKRIIGDAGRPDELGPYLGTRGHKCVDVVGGGNSPVLAYDRQVVETAVRYLEQDHEKPQCIVVGLYGPHFPYVAPIHWYNSYRERADLPRTRTHPPDYEQNPFVQSRTQAVSDERVKRIRAAYYGMISCMDEQLGQVRASWTRYLERRGRKGVFVYLSDHGDTAGEHGLHGKLTFYEGSAKIPLIFQGEGIREGGRIAAAASIADVGPTLCGLAGAEPPAAQDGRSLLDGIVNGTEDTGRHVRSELVEIGADGDIIPAVMVKRGKWKWIRYYKHESDDLLFDTEADPYEIHNALEARKDIATELSGIADREWKIDSIIRTYRINRHNHALLRRWEKASGYLEKEQHPIRSEDTELPVVY